MGSESGEGASTQWGLRLAEGAVLDSKVVHVSTETDRTVMTHPSSIDEKQEQQS